MKPAHIVLATYGSYGDLHPYLAIAIGLKRAGHHVILATSEFYRSKVEGEGVPFQPLPPDLFAWQHDEEAKRKAMDLRTGTEFIVRKMFVPYVEQSYEELLALARNADLLIGHTLTFALPMVAEKLGIPWLSAMLQPASLLSRYDPPLFPGAEWLRFLRPLGPLPQKAIFAIGKIIADRWVQPVADLRARLGLPAARKNPLLEPASPHGNMAWFSRILARPQPDWPARTVITGFPFYDQEAPGTPIPSDLDRFLSEGDAPVVFTLGTSAALNPGDFFEESFAAAESLQIRAVLLSPAAERMRDRPHSERIFFARYAPYSAVFSRALLNVHQGGIGTTAQALRSGRPMIVVPYSHDQPDNADRMQRLGVARVIRRSAYRRRAIEQAIRQLTNDQKPTVAAHEAATTILAEDAIGAAREFIERTLD